MAVAARKVPSPADAPAITARALVARTKREGGRVYRMREHSVFVVTENKELAQWLLRMGGSPYLPTGMLRSDEMRGSYVDAKGGRPKWDIYIHTIPTKGERTVWEAAGLADAETFEP